MLGIELGPKRLPAISECTADDLVAMEAIWPRRGCSDRYARQCAGESSFLLARDDERLVGRGEVLWTGPRMPEVARALGAVAEINGLDVLSKFRSHGIGTAIVRAAEDLARRRGCTHIGLGVGVNNDAAERLYRRLRYEGDLTYTDRYVWTDASGTEHAAADPCRFLTKRLL